MMSDYRHAHEENEYRAQLKAQLAAVTAERDQLLRLVNTQGPARIREIEIEHSNEKYEFQKQIHALETERDGLIAERDELRAKAAEYVKRVECAQEDAAAFHHKRDAEKYRADDLAAKLNIAQEALLDLRGLTVHRDHEASITKALAAIAEKDAAK